MPSIFSDFSASAGMANSHRYTPIGDIIVIGMCMLLFILLIQTAIHKDKNFKLLIGMLVTSLFHVTSNVIYQMLLSSELLHAVPLYIFHSLHQISLIVLLYLYIRYLHRALRFTSETKKFYYMSYGAMLLSLLVDVLGMIFHFTFYIDSSGPHSSFNAYQPLTLLFVLTVFALIIKHHSCVIRQVFWGLLGANLISVLVLVIQYLNGQISYTGAAFFLPIMAIVLIFHSNPFDLNTGAASDVFLLHTLEEHKTPLLLISCHISNFLHIIATSEALKSEYYQFLRHNVRKGIIYRLENDRLALTIPKIADEAQQERLVAKMLENFLEIHSKLELDYKIVVMETTPEIQSGTDYIRIIEAAERSMPFNTIHRIRHADIEHFYQGSYILSELEDIAARRDLDDTRILVYCQPVFNVCTGTYDTAEALMRLKLPKTGMVYPDQFIPLAEQYGHIHALSMIILNKTCGAIRTLMENDLDIMRISVNFSTLDIRYDSFCAEVQQIIARNQIPYHKIAIEITESRNEADFNIMKTKVEELRELGIKFYLDDFGTGYSNFERIMEIPFDIIKFDRSMTIESTKNEDSFYMVSTFANMFSALHYSVLFEGVEDENDEQNCVKMSGKYMQGYKYSKPIPIEQLESFLLEKQIV